MNSDHDNSNNSKRRQVSLRVAETDSKFVGKGIALVDPKVIKDLVLNTGDVVEISGIRRKAHELLWSSHQSDYGKKLIRIDGYTRNNLGIGIDDNVSINEVISNQKDKVSLVISLKHFEAATKKIKYHWSFH
jgi:transitional endoplasmic reticulum ATPase